ncbi:MAG TPA: MOSC domain-containing protein [Steroidobacteraceae bacterium]|nr:MOSC domain-containing protein [Steroidobacteraceae bacterium]
MITISSLHVYPVKSCRGIECEQVHLTEAGLEHDREWMVVSPDGRFLTQREEPKLARIATRLAGAELQLSVEAAAPSRFLSSRPGKPSRCPSGASAARRSSRERTRRTG